MRMHACDPPEFLVYKARKEPKKTLFSSKKDFLIKFSERNAYILVAEPLEDFRRSQKTFSYSEEEEGEYMAWDDFPEWFRRRMRRAPFFRSWFFGDLEEIMRDMEEMMEREFREFKTRVPKDLVRERKLPDGSTRHEWGPFVYGYSITVGPDGKPKIREFGNVKPSRRPEAFGVTKPSLEIKEEREPLVDVITTDGEVKVIAELPGVEREDIKLHGTETSLTVSVDTPQRKYHKEVKLPAKVDPKEAKSSYKNGVLEVTFQKRKREKPEGEPIKIE